MLCVFGVVLQTILDIYTCIIIYIYMCGFGSFRAMIVNGPCGDPLYPKRKLGREVGCLNTIFFRNMNPEEIPF